MNEISLFVNEAISEGFSPFNLVSYWADMYMSDVELFWLIFFCIKCKICLFLDKAVLNDLRVDFKLPILASFFCVEPDSKFFVWIFASGKCQSVVKPNSKGLTRCKITRNDKSYKQ